MIGFTRSVAASWPSREICAATSSRRASLEAPATRIEENALRTAQRLQTPLGRFGRSEELAATVAFLASDDAAFFVGETLNVNGGLVTN